MKFFSFSKNTLLIFNNKSLLGILFCFFFFYLSSYSFVQSKNVVKVNTIRKEYQRINSAKLQKREIRYKNNCGVKNATITIYSENGVIVKITDNGNGDDHLAEAKWNYEIYYKNGKLIFSYKWIKGSDEMTGDSYIDEERSYIDNDRVIKVIENGKTQYPSNKRIESNDFRYQLKHVQTKSDIEKIYDCGN